MSFKVSYLITVKIIFDRSIPYTVVINIRYGLAYLPVSKVYTV